jgi:caffeoyl-CoA O-methyltransferase
MARLEVVMAGKGFEFTDELRSYVMDHSALASETDALAAAKSWMIERTHEALADVSGMQIAPEQGPLLTMLAQTLDARLIVEVGTFTGLSALCLAEGLADGGRVLCHDRSEEWTPAREGGGQTERDELRLEPRRRPSATCPTSRRPGLHRRRQGRLHGYHDMIARPRRGLLVVTTCCGRAGWSIPAPTTEAAGHPDTTTMPPPTSGSTSRS